MIIQRRNDRLKPLAGGGDLFLLEQQRAFEIRRAEIPRIFIERLLQQRLGVFQPALLHQFPNFARNAFTVFLQLLAFPGCHPARADFHHSVRLAFLPGRQIVFGFFGNGRILILFDESRIAVDDRLDVGDVFHRSPQREQAAFGLDDSGRLGADFNPLDIVDHQVGQLPPGIGDVVAVLGPFDDTFDRRPVVQVYDLAMRNTRDQDDSHCQQPDKGWQTNDVSAAFDHRRSSCEIDFFANRSLSVEADYKRNAPAMASKTMNINCSVGSSSIHKCLQD